MGQAKRRGTFEDRREQAIILKGMKYTPIDNICHKQPNAHLRQHRTPMTSLVVLATLAAIGTRRRL